MTARPPTLPSAWAQPPHPARPASGPRITVAPANAARILLAAGTVGLLAQLLLVGQSIGVNLGLATLAVLAAARVVRRPGRRTDPADRWLVPAAITFALLPTFRAAPALVAWDGMAAVALTGFAVAATLGARVTRRTAAAISTLAIVGVMAAAVGTLYLTPGLASLRGRLGMTRGSAAWPVVRGLVLALPVVAVFVALFASGDAVFQRLLADTLHFDLDLTEWIVRLGVALTIAWGVAGVFAFGVDPAQLERRLHSDASGASPRTQPRIGSVETSVVLIAVDLLFGAFVVVQAAYLFGGRDTLELTGLSYSEYARRGFFELIGAAALAGLVIMALHTLSGRTSRVFTAGATVLAILAGVVLVSAAARLGLYQEAYGWTELRFYAIAAVVWVGAGLTAAAMLLGVGGTRWLPHTVAVAALVVAFGVNVADPQAFVAQRNVERARHPETIAEGGRSGLDAEYLVTLGDDAVPTLVAALPTLPPPDAIHVRRALVARRVAFTAAFAVEGWPSFNLSRARARDALANASLDAAPAR